MEQSQRLAYSIVEAARIAGIGRSTFYADIANKHVPVRKFGRRSLILHDDLMAWLESLPVTSSPAPGGTEEQTPDSAQLKSGPAAAEIDDGQKL